LISNAGVYREVEEEQGRVKGRWFGGQGAERTLKPP